MPSAHDRVLAAFASVADSSDAAYLLSRDLRILRTNAGWKQFALANNGGEILARWGAGSSLLDAIPTQLRDTYRRGFASAFASGKPWEHDYECSSADVYREFRMVATCPGSGIMLVAHALRVSRPHEHAVHIATDTAYVADSVILMCMYCRQVKHRATERWHWVPAYVATMPSNVSHGLCPRCAELHAND